MSQARIIDVTGARRISRTKLKGWLEWGRHWLYRYRAMLRDWRFWLVQGLVIVIAVIHGTIEVGGFLPRLGILYFIPISLFLVPVVYAALTFGLAGSVVTALWVTVITIPNWIFWHQGLERWGVMFQMLIVNAVAYFVGQRVDRETGARQQAEAAAAALKASEMKYRRLFESSPIAILVLDPTGVVLEANPAASVLFGRESETLKSMVMADLVGMAGAQKLLSSSRNGKRQADSPILRLRDGQQVYIEPTLIQDTDIQGNSVIEVLLRDITDEEHRRAGLRAYTASMIRGQEEERQRISRELHDDSIQALVLLCRQLDSVKNASVAMPPSAIAELREARRTAEGVVKGLRDFAKALRPPTLDDLGMVVSIRRLLVDFTERAGIEGKLKVVGEERRLPRDTELGMFRIAQEALWNVEHHAGAIRVTVTMAFAEDEARLDVLDNGVGFTVPPDPGDFTASGQLGLIGMQERAELLGGKLVIKSSPKKGTRVTACIPIRQDILEVPGHSRDL